MEHTEKDTETHTNIFMRRAVEAAKGDKDKAALAVQLAELSNEKDALLEYNREMSKTYEEVFATFPSVKELDLILRNLNLGNEGKIASIADFNDYVIELHNNDELKERIARLEKFRTALVMIEKNDVRIKPKKYEVKDE